MIQVKYTRYKPQGAFLRLSDERYNLDVDDRSGVVKGLYLKDDPFGTNFAGNEQNMRLNTWWKRRHVPEKSQRVPMYCWTGDVVLKARLEDGDSWRAMHTFLSDDVRTVCYDDHSITTRYTGSSAASGGLQGLDLEQIYELSGDGIVWSVALRNAAAESVVIGELGLPIVLNSNYTTGDLEQGFNHRSVDSTRYVFEQRIIAHYCISGHSSYIYATRPAGKGDILLITPQGDTALEAVIGDTYFGDCVQTDMMIATGPIYYLHAGTAIEGSSYNPRSTLLLAPGQKRRFSFKISRARDYKELEENLYRHGKVTTRIVPGMVLPLQSTAHLLLRCPQEIEAVEGGPGIAITPSGRLGHRYAYTVRLLAAGQQKVTVRYGEGKWANLLFYGTEPLEKLIKARAAFIAAKQQVKDPEDLCHFSFRVWNNKKDRLLVMEDTGGPLEGGNIEMGGGDDRNFGEPLFLSGKNVYYPVQEEIKALDDFVEGFLYGGLQNRETLEVKNSMIGTGQGSWRRWDHVWRIYTYAHVYNIYYNLYRIASLPGGDLSRGPLEYLHLAYETCLASLLDSTYESIYEGKNYMDYHVGNMSYTHAVLNNWSRARMMAAMQAEGMDDEYATLRQRLQRTYPYFLEESYPYATEYCFDQAGYEGVYHIGKEAGSRALQQKTVEVLLASRHIQPLWFLHGTALRTIGNYDTPLGAICLLDAYETGGNHFLLQMGYAGLLAPWSCVSPEGKAYHTRDRRFMPPQEGEPGYSTYFNGHFSGELGVGLYGDLNALKSYLVHDPDFGLIGYGCEAAETEVEYELRPWDGLGVRAYLAPLGIDLETVHMGIEAARIAKDGARMLLQCRPTSPGAHSARVRIRGVSAGSYRCRVEGEPEQRAETADGSLNWAVRLGAATTEIRIERAE